MYSLELPLKAQCFSMSDACFRDQRPRGRLGSKNEAGWERTPSDPSCDCPGWQKCAHLPPTPHWLELMGYECRINLPCSINHSDKLANGECRGRGGGGCRGPEEWQSPIAIQEAWVWATLWKARWPLEHPGGTLPVYLSTAGTRL